MQLDPALLNDAQLNDARDPIDPTTSIHGVYNHVIFVLRLNPKVHDILYQVEAKDTGDLTPGEIHQALSTLFHETMHWWQFIGSTSGLIMSLSMPAQTMFNLQF